MDEKFEFDVNEQTVEALLASDKTYDGRTSLRLPVTGPQCNKLDHLGCRTANFWGTEGYTGLLIQQTGDKAGAALALYDSLQHSDRFDPKAIPLASNNCVYSSSRLSIPRGTDKLEFPSERYPDPVHAGLVVSNHLGGHQLGQTMRGVCEGVDKVLIQRGLLSGDLREEDGALQYETAEIINLCYTYLCLGYVPIGIVWDRCEEDSRIDFQYFQQGNHTPLLEAAEKVILTALRFSYHQRVDPESSGFGGSFPRCIRFQKDPEAAATWRDKVRAPFGQTEWKDTSQYATRSAFYHLEETET